ncbi:MAG: hypothetical protein V3V16_04350 [Melioribacteraceae bacterium]
MPNTLAHIGINGLLTRSVMKKSDLFWIYFGTIIPDIPWIIQRLVQTFSPSTDGFDLRLYVIVQATLLFSLILSLIFSFLTDATKRTFLILAFGSLLHLLIDSFQIKWANGVHLFAPFNWELLNFGLFWPESLPTYILTFSGIVYFIFNWNTLRTQKLNLKFNSVKFSISFLLLFIYLLTPFYFMSHVEEANNHFIKTLRKENNRAGKFVEFDRKKIEFNELTNQYSIQTFDKSFIPVEGISRVSANKISLRGKFIDNKTIKVIDYHEHIVWFRDGASYIGLILVLIAGVLKLKYFDIAKH